MFWNFSMPPIRSMNPDSGIRAMGSNSWIDQNIKSKISDLSFWLKD